MQESLRNISIDHSSVMLKINSRGLLDGSSGSHPGAADQHAWANESISLPRLSLLQSGDAVIIDETLNGC